MGLLAFCAILAFLQVGQVYTGKPQFTDYSALDNRYVEENAFNKGDVIGQIKAVDPDGDPILYEIADKGFEYFQIDRDTGVVTLKLKLNFDVQKEIKMFIIISDGNSEPNRVSAKFIILDSNNHEPEFDRYDIYKKLPENAKLGTVVDTLSVSDRDTNQDVISVRCQRDSEEHILACDKFDVSFSPANTSNRAWLGDLVLVGSLDFETKSSYALALVAFDGVFNVTNQINIELEDINDSPPKWTRITPKIIDEELPTTSYVMTVTATDGDITNPRPIRYEIIDGTTQFAINNETGKITIAQVIDFDDPTHKKNAPIEIKIKASEVISTNPFTLGNDAVTTSTAVVSVTIQDIDDNRPTFDKKEYVVSIPENIVSGSNIPGLQMTITDIDSGTFLYNTFDLVSLNYNDVFAIIPNNGKANAGATLYVVNSEKIDFELGLKQYIINLEARENAPNLIKRLTGSATVTINVKDVNDQSPIFPKETFYEDVSETASANKMVIDLNAEDSEFADFGTSGIRYKLYGDDRNHFTIDEKTGAITVSNCPSPNKPGTFPCIDHEWKQRYFLTVSATDNLGNRDTGRTKSVQVIISVLDENDNVPKPEDAYIAYIYEEETIPVEPLIIKAEDPDVEGSPVTYELDGDPNVLANWQITNKKNSLGDDIGEITARRPVLFSDATDPDDGTLTFQVVSSDQKNRVSSPVTIHIIDINNNAPEFSIPKYTHEIWEDTEGEVFVITVTASDGDAPTTGNGIVDFSIASGARGKFITKSTRKEGDNYLVDIFTTPDATFNYDLTKEYEMELVALDQGTPESKRGTALLIVEIVDINNNAPHIIPNTISISVPEDKQVNSFVYQVNAKDIDKDSELRYYLTPTEARNPPGGIVDKNVYNYEELFRIEDSTGIVRVNKGLNREMTSFLINSLTVVDIAANPPQTGTGAFFITITEVNDQDPAFEKPLYNITVDEELNINYFVQNLICRDEDDEIIRYELVQKEPRSPNYFTLLDNSGSLIISNRIDYEKLDEINLMATCFDDGIPQRSGTTQIAVTIRNINDNSPEFAKPLYTAEIEETSQGTDIGGHVLTVVFASDIDKGDFGVVRYRLPQNEPYFEIDRLNGTITVKPNVQFDREVQASYGFIVIAYDSPNYPNLRRETPVSVYLTITDINDNCPKFSDKLYTGSIPESAKVGTDIIDVIATDRDYGINKRIAFTIEDGSFDPEVGSQFFDIGVKSGRVFTLSTLSGKYGLYRFNVTATDTEGLNADKCSVHMPAEVTVSQSQNYAPNWIRPPKRDFVIYVLESQYEGMLVYNSKAEDLDPGRSGVVDYYFVDGNQNVAATKEFRINQVTGIIRAEIEYDREDIDTYFLTLVARDQGATRASSEITLIVVIMDVDDNDPVFKTKNGKVVPLELPEFDFKEGTVPPTGGLKVGKCSATDADSDHDHNKIFYEILSGDPDIHKMVRVDRDNCGIYLLQEMDYETTPVLEFSIYAFNERSDDTVKRYRREVKNPSILQVIIRVEDDNDNPPVFTDNKYFACADLKSPFKTSIIDLDAHDKEQEDLELMYSLENTNAFTITNAGIIHNSISFVSTSARAFEFNAKVSDGENFGASQVNIFVTEDSTQVMLKVNRPSSDVLRIQKTYEDYFMKSSSDIRHVCVDIKNHVTDEGKISNSESDVYVAAVGWNSFNRRYALWSQTQLYDHIKDDRKTHKDFYNTELFVSGVSKVDDNEFSLDEDVVLAILIIAILLIAFAILLFILACYCIWAKKKKKVRKIKAQRHTVVQSIPAKDESFSNPVYATNEGFVYEEEYSTVSKTKSSIGPISPVVIPAPQNLQPLTTFQPVDLEPEEPETPPEIPEPYIETEVMPAEEQEAVSPPMLMDPEYEDHIETVVEDGDNYNNIDDDDDNINDLPLPDPPATDEIEIELVENTPPAPLQD